MTVAQMFRMIWIDAFLNDRSTGLRRATMQLIFDQSVPQTSIDLRRFMQHWPDRMVYNRSAKEYRATPGSTPVFPLEVSARVRIACLDSRILRDAMEQGTGV